MKEKVIRVKGKGTVSMAPDCIEAIDLQAEDLSTSDTVTVVWEIV